MKTPIMCTYQNKLSAMTLGNNEIIFTNMIFKKLIINKSLKAKPFSILKFSSHRNDRTQWSTYARLGVCFESESFQYSNPHNKGLNL